MTTCEFKTNGEAQSKEIMDSIWEAIHDWIEHDCKELILCQWNDKEGDHVSISVVNGAEITISLNYNTFEKNPEHFELVLMYNGDLRKVAIPANVVTQISHVKLESNTEKEELDITEPTEEFEGTKKLFDNILEDYRRISNGEGYVTGLSTGYYDLDYRTRGLHNGQLTLLTGRKWVGKTNFALNIAYNAIKREKVPVAIFSLDLSGDQIARRLMILDINKPLEKAFCGAYKDVSRLILENSANMLKESKLYIDDDQNITTKKILDKCLAIKEKSGLGLVIIDGMLKGTDGYEYKYQTLSRLKDFAKQLDCPVFVTADEEKEEDKHSEKVGTSDWGHCYRAIDVRIKLLASFPNNCEEETKSEVKLVVNMLREGRIGKVRLDVDPEINKFKNIGAR